MALSRRPKVAYGLSQPDFAVGPIPILADRAPTPFDFAEIGTLWIESTLNEIWVITSVVNNLATWVQMVAALPGGALDGQVLIGATGGPVFWENITSLNGTVTIADAPNTIDLSVNGGGIVWQTVPGVGPVAMVANHGYELTGVGRAALTLPVVSPLGSQIFIGSNNAGFLGFTISQNAGQNIICGEDASTVGVLGNLNTINGVKPPYQSLMLICTTADTQWTIFTTNCPNLDLI